MYDDPVIAIQCWLNHRDQDAAAWLVNEHRPQVLRTARSWGAPAWMEEDVAQEVFLRVFRALHRFEPRMPFAHWLAVIARNTCAKLRRRWCRRHRLCAGFEDGARVMDDEAVCRQASPDDQLVHKEHLALLCLALSRLSERDRLLLEGGSTILTAAQRVALHRARTRLRRHFSTTLISS